MTNNEMLAETFARIAAALNSIETTPDAPTLLEMTLDDLDDTPHRYMTRRPTEYTETQYRTIETMLNTYIPLAFP